jgi:hypothetical protein
VSHILNELQKVKDYYAQDALQKRFSALICGESGSGKTFLLRTCRLPVHIDSFDPGGTKCLLADPKMAKDDPKRIFRLRTEENPKGQIIADTQWEGEDPLSPDRFAKWKKVTDYRLMIGYFKYFGTYALDTTTTWATSAMYGQTDGAVPDWGKDYVPVKHDMTIYITKLMALSCDFLALGHLNKNEKLLSYDRKSGIKTFETTYRFLTVGKAVVTIPLLFDELYVLKTTEKAAGLERYIVTEAQGEYQARSRLKGSGMLNVEEPADIKSLLRKIGMSDEDKPRLDTIKEE